MSDLGQEAEVARSESLTTLGAGSSGDLALGTKDPWSDELGGPKIPVVGHFILFFFFFNQVISLPGVLMKAFRLKVPKIQVLMAFH